MRTYKVWIADKLTRWPLGRYEIKALTKWHARRKAFKEICHKDKGYLIIVSRL